MPYPGVDIIEIDRFKKACQRQPRLAERLFTKRELTELENKGIQSWAARFAGKEAILKTLGTGLSGLSWHDIEIINNENGEPLVFLTLSAKAKLLSRGGSQIRISLAHDRSKAIAMAILE